MFLFFGSWEQETKQTRLRREIFFCYFLENIFEQKYQIVSFLEHNNLSYNKILIMPMNRFF